MLVLVYTILLTRLFFFCFFFFFFFSSRRRHTRLTCDWSSDVCSSDLRGRFGADADAGLDQEGAGSEEVGEEGVQEGDLEEGRREGHDCEEGFHQAVSHSADTGASEWLGGVRRCSRR